MCRVQETVARLRGLPLPLRAPAWAGREPCGVCTAAVSGRASTLPPTGPSSLSAPWPGRARRAASFYQVILPSGGTRAPGTASPHSAVSLHAGVDQALPPERRAPVTPAPSTRYHRRRSSGSRDERYRSGKARGGRSLLPACGAHGDGAGTGGCVACVGQGGGGLGPAVRPQVMTSCFPDEPPPGVHVRTQ